MSTGPASDSQPSVADPLVFLGVSPTHAELLAVCDRLAHVWRERARNESALWSKLGTALAATSDVNEALQVYSDTATERLHVTLENAQRILEERQKIIAHFSRTSR